MPFEIPPQTLGNAVAILISLLGAAVLAIQLRHLLAEKPDPKTTYATLTQHNNIQTQIHHYEKQTQKNITQIRKDLKHNIADINHHNRRSFENLHRLCSDCLQKTAAVASQNQINQQRITELTLKSDKILAKMKF